MSTVGVAHRLVGANPRTAGYALGVAGIVAGGLVAAITGPLQLNKGSWLAAYLVLICGVAQCILARQDQFVGLPADMGRVVWASPILWAGGNALVILGALSSTPFATDIGGIALAAALVIAALRTRGAPYLRRARLLRAWFVVLAASIPIGLVLTHLRAAG